MVLKAKGLPPKFCAVLEAIHRGTKVQSMANRRLTQPLGVSSGISQGCPLASLIFIIAVDIRYDEVELDTKLAGIPRESDNNDTIIQLSGYAGDTGIYVANQNMPVHAIQAVARFSARSGLYINARNWIGQQTNKRS